MNQFAYNQKRVLFIIFIVLGLIFMLVPIGRVAGLGFEHRGAILTTSRGILDGNSPTAKIIHVDKDASSGGDGTSWAKAFQGLQAALAAAGTGDQIWIAEGTYKPGTNRTNTFQLLNNVAIYGGFIGNENNLNQRNWQTNETILSGDIGTPAVDSDNSYHVVTGSGTNASALLDGFTISGGKANGAAHTDPDPCDQLCGAGIYNLNGSPTLKNLLIKDNIALDEGGGMFNASSSNPALTNVTLTSNDAVFGGGMSNDDSSPSLTNTTFISNTAGFQGGGLHNVDGSSSTLTGVIFEDNKAGNNGGGMFNRASQSILVNVTFLRNDADNNGGGMYSEFLDDAIYPTLNGATFAGNRALWGGGISNVDCSMVVINAVFSGNVAEGGRTNPAEQGGGAIHNYSSNPTLTNVTITGNESADNGGGIRNHNNSLPVIQNSIIWDNEAPTGKQIFNDATSHPTIQYSDVQGSGGVGNGNIDSDPKFVRLPSPGTDGEWGTPDDDYGDLHLQGGSPAISAGHIQLDPDPNSSPPDSMFDIPNDIDGNPRIFGGIEMGAYTFGDKELLFLPTILKS